MSSDAEQPSATAPSAAAQTERGRSTIEFPYCALDDSEEIAAAVHAVGGTSCQWDQLAAHLKAASGGGGFRVRMMAARTFGLLNYDRGEVSLSELGIRIIDAKHQRAARVEAFLNPQLYKVVYDRLKGQMLPPTAAIERMMEGLGVVSKQKDKARQVFTRSAKHAGFFELASDRLVQPNTNNAGAGVPDAPQMRPEPKDHSGGGNGGGGYHPFIEGLLKTLPQPDSDWPINGRVKWLQAASNIFGLIYADQSTDSVIEIKVAKL